MGQHRNTSDLSSYFFGRQQPSAVDVEAAVLGAILSDREALSNVVDILRADTFYSDAHSEIYSACLALFAESRPIDILTATEELRKRGTLENIGGSFALVELTNRVASTANIEYHARILAQKALSRGLISTASDTIGKAYSDENDPFDLLEKTQEHLFALSNFSGKNEVPIHQIGAELVKQIDRAMMKPDGITGVPTGWKAMDVVTGGWQPSDLIILAARPGMGKTSLALCTLLHAAKHGYPVGMFSLEMGETQLFERLASAETGISASSIKRGQLNGREHEEVLQAIGRISQLPIFIDGTPGLSIFEMRAKARRMARKHGIKLFIVDYLQLMSGPDNGRGNREQEVSAISRGLKVMAKEINVPVIALSQLSRAVESQGGPKRPSLHHLRDSGGIEQDADMVAFIYRPDYYDIKEDENGAALPDGFTEILIEKHRHGPLETVGLKWDGTTTKFSDLNAPTQFPAQAATYQPIQPNRNEEVPF